VGQTGVCLVVITGWILSFSAACRADGNAARASDLALEVEALRTLNDLQPNEAQLRQLRDLSAGAAGDTKTAETDAVDSAAQENRGCQLVLVALREALISGNADEIAKNEKALDAWEERLQVNFSPRITPSLPARNAADKILRLFTGPQIANLVAQRNEEVSDPTEILLTALAQCRGMKLADFQAFNEDVSNEIADLVAGVVPKNNRSVYFKVAALMRTAYRLHDDDYDSQRPDLQDKAKQITKVNSSDVLRHWVKWEIVELISNPQADLALTERPSWADQTASNSQGAP
jgi:hypothetical protein